MQYQHADFMQRCIDLATLGKGLVHPNPMVGAVLVYNNIIIGEGWHQQYGGPHAEVICLNSVAKSNQHLIAQSTLYVSLEPCAHHGKTPPCAQLIIDHHIPNVVIGCQDPFNKVNGNGIAILKAHGITTTVGVLAEACIKLNAAFFTFHQNKRPYIYLKWAATADNFIAPIGKGNVQISNAFAKLWLHKLRSEQAAFAIGSQTAILDNPQLTNRLWSQKKQPTRIIFDPGLNVPESANIYNQEAPTIVFNNIKNCIKDNVTLVKISTDSFLTEAMAYLYSEDIQSIVVEGGSYTLQSFIDAGLWDAAWIIKAPHCMQDGVAAPKLKDAILVSTERLGDNELIQYLRQPAK